MKLKSILLALACSLLLMAQTTTKVDYPTQVRNGPLFSDAGPVGSTLQSLCAAVGAGTLAITKQWTGLATQTVSCNLQFAGGLMQPASGQTVTLAGSVTGGLSQLFDETLGGAVALSSAKIPAIYPEWFGAASDGSTIDDVAINETLAAGINGPTVYMSHTAAVKNISITMTSNDRISLMFAPRVLWTCTNSDNSTCVHFSSASGNPVITISGMVLRGGDGSRGQDGCTTTSYGSGLVFNGGAAQYLHLSNIETYGFCHSGSAGVLIDGAENSDWNGGSVGWSSDIGWELTNSTSGVWNNISATGSNSKNIYLLNVEGTFNGIVAQGGEKTGVYADGLGASIFTNLYLESNNLSSASNTCGLELHADTGYTINNKFIGTVLHLVNETAGICTKAPTSPFFVSANVFDQNSFSGSPSAVNLNASSTFQEFVDFSGTIQNADGSTVIRQYVISPGQQFLSAGSASAPTYSFNTSHGTGMYWDGTNLGFAVAGSSKAVFTPSGTASTTSWTPSLEFGSDSTGITYTTQAASCYVIGRLAIISVNITLSSKGSATGIAQIIGLPAACQSTGQAASISGSAVISTTATALPGVAGTSLQGTTITLITNYTNGLSFVTDVNLTNTSSIQFTLAYSL